MKHTKFILPLLLASAALMSCGETPPKGGETVDPNEISVIIMGGQSNMEGNSLTAYLGPEKGFTTEKIQEYSAGYMNVPIFFNNPAGHNTSNHVFVPTRLGQGYNAARFGPELGLADRLNELGYGLGKTGKQVALIKYAWGGTGLAPQLKQWASPSISNGNTCRDYYGFVQTVMEGLGFLENEGYNPVIKAMLWMQGEADACNATYAQNYLANTRGFVRDLRDEFAGYYGKKEKEFAYIDAAISAHQYPNGNNIWAHQALVNSAKATFASESDLNYYLDTNSGEHDLDTSTEPINNPDYYHYDVASMIDLGKMFADTVVEVLNKY